MRELNRNTREALRFSVEPSTAAGAWPSGISAGTAGSRLGHTGAGLGGHGESRQLWGQLLAVALGAFGFLFAIHESFELVFALLANVLKNRHGLRLSGSATQNSVVII